MRFSSYINNAKCLEWGLNANQGALFDLLNQASGWAHEVVINGVVYYWVSRNEVISELPLFYSKPDTVYRHFVELDRKDLIDYLKVDGKDLIRLSEKQAYNAKLADAQARVDYFTRAKNAPKFGAEPSQVDGQGQVEEQSKPSIVTNENINTEQSAEVDLDPVKHEDLSHLPDFAHNHERIWKGQKNGQPFKSEQAAENSEVFKKAEDFRLNPTVVEKDGVFLVEIDKADDIKFSRSAPQETQSFYETEQRLGGKEAYEQAVKEGKTELDYRQWVQVRTPEFKAWFGDWENDPQNASKVINPKTGEPLVVHHNTDAEFNTFDLAKARQGVEIPAFFFANNTDTSYGPNQKNVFLNVRNPSDKPSISTGKDGKMLRNELEQQGVDGTIVDDSFDDWVDIEYSAFNPRFQ